MRRAGIKKIANQWSAALRVQISTSASLMCRQGPMLRAPACIPPPLGSALPGSLSPVPEGAPGSPPHPQKRARPSRVPPLRWRSATFGQEAWEPRHRAGRGVRDAACGTPGPGTLRPRLRNPPPLALPRTRRTSRQGSLRKLSQNRLNCN